MYVDSTVLSIILHSPSVTAVTAPRGSLVSGTAPPPQRLGVLRQDVLRHDAVEVGPGLDGRGLQMGAATYHPATTNHPVPFANVRITKRVP